MDQQVLFSNEGQTIRANLVIPSPGAPCIVISHGLEGSKDGEKWLEFVPKLVREGYACLRFNYRGCGKDKDKSDGDFIDTTLTKRIQDYYSAISFTQTCDIDKSRIGVIGSSFGGTVAIAARDRRIKAMVSLSTPCTFKKPSQQEMRLYETRGFYELPSGRRLLLAFFQDFHKYDVCKAAGEMGCPLMVIHGSSDRLVTIDDARDIYHNSSKPKRLAIIDGASHGFDDPVHLKEVINMTIDWFRKYL